MAFTVLVNMFSNFVEMATVFVIEFAVIMLVCAMFEVAFVFVLEFIFVLIFFIIVIIMVIAFSVIAFQYDSKERTPPQ